MNVPDLTQDFTEEEIVTFIFCAIMRATPVNFVLRQTVRGVVLKFIASEAFGYCVAHARQFSQLQNHTFYRLVAASNLVIAVALIVGGISLNVLKSDDSAGLMGIVFWGCLGARSWLRHS